MRKLLEANIIVLMWSGYGKWEKVRILSEATGIKIWGR
jgi:hypothetical protein